MNRRIQRSQSDTTTIVVQPDAVETYLLREKLRRLSATIPEGEARILLVGGGAVLRDGLMRRGGEWVAAEFTRGGDESGASDKPKVGPGSIPFEDGSFNGVVLVDILEYVQDETIFVRECHRVLAEGGWLVVHGRHLKRWTLMSLCQRVLGVEADQQMVRRGYSQTALFEVVKDGFDIERFEVYSRFPSELVGLISLLVLAGPEDLDYADWKRRLMWALGWVAARLDFLAFGTAGYRFVTFARRRVWRPRRSPVLRDGRTIAEAALGGKIGSAAPF